METLGYYLLIDATLSLIVFGFLYLFRKSLLNRLRYKLQSFLGINSIDSRVSDLENGEDEDYYEEDDEEEEELKPTMKAAMDEVYKLDKQ